MVDVLQLLQYVGLGYIKFCINVKQLWNIYHNVRWLWRHIKWRHIYIFNMNFKRSTYELHMKTNVLLIKCIWTSYELQLMYITMTDLWHTYFPHSHKPLVVNVLQLSPYVGLGYIKFCINVKELRNRYHIVTWLCGLTLSDDTYIFDMISWRSTCELRMKTNELLIKYIWTSYELQLMYITMTDLWHIYFPHSYKPLVVNVLQLSSYVGFGYIKFCINVKELRNRYHNVTWLCGLTLSDDTYIFNMIS